MGHEYVELKNTAAAVDAYRHAVDINAKDYRAWFDSPVAPSPHILTVPLLTIFSLELYPPLLVSSDSDPRTRACRYGLGQTYELLQMPFYALFYYRKATALRPYDARMWCAMAGCYKLLNRKQDAIKCYQRAESNYDREGIAYTELARLFRDEGEKEQVLASLFRTNASCH